MMKAYLTSITYSKSDECYRLDFSMNEFLEFNKTVAKANFYDTNYNPCLTWFEACYPDNGKIYTYWDEGYDIDIFNIVKNNPWTECSDALPNGLSKIINGETYYNNLYVQDRTEMFHIAYYDEDLCVWFEVNCSPIADIVRWCDCLPEPPTI